MRSVPFRFSRMSVAGARNARTPDYDQRIATDSRSIEPAAVHYDVRVARPANPATRHRFSSKTLPAPARPGRWTLSTRSTRKTSVSTAPKSLLNPIPADAGLPLELDPRSAPERI